MNDKPRKCQCGSMASAFYEYDILENYCGYVACHACDIRTDSYILSSEYDKNVRPDEAIKIWNYHPLEDELVTALEAFLMMKLTEKELRRCVDLGEFKRIKTGRRVLAKAKAP